MTDLESLINTVTCCDALALMEQLPPASVDAIITDLPYGKTNCAWDEIIPFEPMWAGVKRVLKPRGVFVTTASQPFTSKLVMSNLAWFKYAWVWNKVNLFTNQMNAHLQPMRQHEDILIFGERLISYTPQLRLSSPYKTKRSGKIEVFAVTPRDGENPSGKMYPGTVISIAGRLPNEQGLHPTQKPVALYEYLIHTYTQPGEIVLDFCCGSGTTGVAARNLNRRYILGDKFPDYCDVSRKRLALPYTVNMFETMNTSSVGD